MSTIRIQGLTKRYGPVLGVDDLSFECPARPGDRLFGTERVGPRPPRSASCSGWPPRRPGRRPSAACRTISCPTAVRQVGAALDSNTIPPGTQRRVSICGSSRRSPACHVGGRRVVGLDQGLQRCSGPRSGSRRDCAAPARSAPRCRRRARRWPDRCRPGPSRTRGRWPRGLAVGSERRRRAVRGDCFPGHLALSLIGSGFSSDRAKADAGLAEKPFCLADAAGHRAVRP